MLKSIRKTGHTIKTMLHLLILQAENLETLLLLVNVERCLLYIFGILSQCHPLHNSTLVQPQKELPHFLLVHVKDMLLLLTKVTIILCISITCKERKCF
jgi:hypothetical protein